MAPHLFAWKVLKEQLFLFLGDFEIISAVLTYNRLLQIASDCQDWAVKRTQRLLFSLDERSNKKSAPSMIYCIPVSYFFRAAKARIYPQNHSTSQVIASDKRTTTTRKSHMEVGCCTDEEIISDQGNQESVPISITHFYVILGKPLGFPMGKQMHSRP